MILNAQNSETQSSPIKASAPITIEKPAISNVVTAQQKQVENSIGQDSGKVTKQRQESEIVSVDANGNIYPMPQGWFAIIRKESVNAFKQNGQLQATNQELGQPPLENQKVESQKVEEAKSQKVEEPIAEVTIDMSGDEVEAIDEKGQKIVLPPSKNPDGSFKMHNGKLAAVINDAGEFLETTPSNNEIQPAPQTQQNTPAQANEIQPAPQTQQNTPAQAYIDLGTAEELQNKLQGIAPNSRVYIPSNQN